MPSGPEHPYVMFQVTTSDNWYCSLCSIPDFWLGETGVSHGALIHPHIIPKILPPLQIQTTIAKLQSHREKVAPFYRNGTKIHKLEALLTSLKVKPVFLFIIIYFTYACWRWMYKWYDRKEGKVELNSMSQRNHLPPHSIISSVERETDSRGERFVSLTSHGSDSLLQGCCHRAAGIPPPNLLLKIE